MRLACLLAVLVPCVAGAQWASTPRPSCGVTESCAAVDYTATITSGDPGFTCTGTGECVDLGPGSCDSVGSDASGNVLFGINGSCTPTVKVGNTSLGNGTVSVNNGAIVASNSYVQINSGSLISGMLILAVTVDIASISANSCDDVTATVTGVETNDVVLVTPNATLAVTDVTVGDAHVTNAGTDEVTFRACNASVGAEDPASTSFLFLVVRKQ